MCRGCATGSLWRPRHKRRSVSQRFRGSITMARRTSVNSSITVPNSVGGLSAGCLRPDRPRLRDVGPENGPGWYRYRRFRLVPIQDGIRGCGVQRRILRDGSFVPFALTRADRVASSDPRLSLEERYGTHSRYVELVRHQNVSSRKD
jgi:hypothetical protein